MNTTSKGGRTNWPRPRRIKGVIGLMIGALCLLLPMPGQAAVTFIQTATGSAFGTSVTAMFPFAPTQNNLLVAIFNNFPPPVTISPHPAGLRR